MLRNRILMFAAFIGLLGLLPHLLFSLNTGELHYVTSAWDEDSYTKYLLTHQDQTYRLLGSILSRVIHKFLGLDLAIIVMDTFLPAISAALAVMLAHTLGFTQRKHWLLASCLILFPLELLSLSNPHLWQDALVKFSPFAGADYTAPIRQFVPSVYQNFFSIYKSPEPQFTLIFHLFALYVLLRHTQTHARYYVLFLLPIAVILPFIYITTSISLLMFIATYAALGLLIFHKRHYWYWLGATLCVGAYVAWAQFFFAHEHEGPEVIFFSRLPIISASVLLGLFGLWVIWRNWRFKLPPNALLAAAAFIVPIATLNQQLMTGIMVQSRSWEYYSNYPFIAFGLLLIWPEISALLPKRILRNASRICVILITLICVAQFMSYKGYQKGDLVALGYADGIKTANITNEYVLLDNPDHDSAVWLRVGDPNLKILAGYQDIIANPIHPLQDVDYAVTYERMRDRAFTLFDRKGIEPFELQQHIKDGIGSGGWYVRYFFALLDCWYPLSDFRNKNPDMMLERIPYIVTDYQEFLNDPKRRNQFGELLYLTETPIRELRDEVPWINQKVALIIEGKWRQKSIYVYRQIPR